MREITVEDALHVMRPKLGEGIPVSLWRLLRLVVMPEVFGKKAAMWNRKMGLALGELLQVKEVKDVPQVITQAQIGVCMPLERKGASYAISFTECFTCSGIKPPVGEAICDFEVAIIEGVFKKLGYTIEDIKETQCIGGLGDKVCRIEVVTDG